MFFPSAQQFFWTQCIVRFIVFCPQGCPESAPLKENETHFSCEPSFFFGFPPEHTELPYPIPDYKQITPLLTPPFPLSLLALFFFFFFFLWHVLFLFIALASYILIPLPCHCPIRHPHPNLHPVLLVHLLKFPFNIGQSSPSSVFLRVLPPICRCTERGLNPFSIVENLLTALSLRRGPSFRPDSPSVFALLGCKLVRRSLPPPAFYKNSLLSRCWCLFINQSLPGGWLRLVGRTPSCVEYPPRVHNWVPQSECLPCLHISIYFFFFFFLLLFCNTSNIPICIEIVNPFGAHLPFLPLSWVFSPPLTPNPYIHFFNVFPLPPISNLTQY